MIINGSERGSQLRRGSRALLRAVLLIALLTLFGVSCAGPAGHARAGGCSAGSGSCAPGAATAPGTAPPSGGGGTAPPNIGRATSTSSPGASTRPPASAPTSAPAVGRLPASGHCASPGACGFPDADSTGPRIPLTAHSGNMTIRTNNVVIRGWDLTGSLDIYANNVTVIDTRVDSTNWWGINLRSGYSGLRVLHSEVTAEPGQGPDNGGEDYAVSNMGVSSVEVGWTDVSVFVNALSMGQGDLHDNYVHDIAAFINTDGQWAHADAVISDGGNTGTLVIRHNTLLNPVGIDRGASASIGLYADTGSVANSVVDDNWLAGGAYALYGGGAGANGIKVTNNVFSTEYHPNSGAYGQVAYWNAHGPGNVWSNNRTSNGALVVPQPSS